MNFGAFERSLRAIHRREPFQPFTVALLNGHRFQVNHPEALVIRAGIAAFIDAGGVPPLFDHESVSEMIGQFTPKVRIEQVIARFLQLLIAPETVRAR